MSCGHHHDTPCSDVLERIYCYLDGELDSDRCAEISKHLDECGPCLDEYGLGKAIKQLVARHCGCDPVPEDLRAKVLSRIEQVRAHLTE